MIAKEKIIAMLKTFGFPDSEVVLSLDDFFSNYDFYNSNNKFASIGVNIFPDQPSPEVFYSTLKNILSIK